MYCRISNSSDLGDSFTRMALRGIRQDTGSNMQARGPASLSHSLLDNTQVIIKHGLLIALIRGRFTPRRSLQIC
jgi:hypothetical protein